jgi:hypothetical protein
VCAYILDPAPSRTSTYRLPTALAPFGVKYIQVKKIQRRIRSRSFIIMVPQPQHLWVRSALSPECPPERGLEQSTMVDRWQTCEASVTSTMAFSQFKGQHARVSCLLSTLCATPANPGLAHSSMLSPFRTYSDCQCEFFQHS